MTTLEFINATDFIPVFALVIAFFSEGSRRGFIVAMGLVSLWLLIIGVIAIMVR